MRLAAAIAILTSCLASANEPTRVDLFLDDLVTAKHIDVRKQRTRRLIHGKFLTNIKDDIGSPPDGRKCDPKASKRSETDADTGILSCPQGEYCSEAGICVTDLSGLDVRTEQVYTYGTDYSLLCNVTDAPYTCDCSDLDQLAETGVIYCDYLAQQCLGSVCYDISGGFTFSGDLGTYDESYYCKKVTAPYKQDICYYYYAGVEDCVISIDGNDCSSCLFLRNDQANGNDCTVFDCTNLPNGKSGNTCSGDFPSSVFDIANPLVPVEATVSFLQAILYGISRLSIDEQIQWATLTAQFIVNFYQTTLPDILEELSVLIEVLAVLPNDPMERKLQAGIPSANIIYNMFLSYLIQDPNQISPSEVAELPFVTEADRANYTIFLQEFGQGALQEIVDVEFLGQRQPIRPGKGGKKGKKGAKSGKKGSKSSKKAKTAKSVKSDKKGMLYEIPPIPYDVLENDYYYKSSKKSKSAGQGLPFTMVGSPQYFEFTSKSGKKGKRRRI